MAEWSPARYLAGRFAALRARPLHDLIHITRRAYPAEDSSQVIRVLDIGCGTGNALPPLLEAFQPFQLEYVGIDSSDAMLDEASKSVGHLPRVSFTNVDFEDLSSFEKLSVTPFDIVFSNAALHWASNPLAMISYIASTLVRRNGGIFAIQVPSTTKQPSHQLMPSVFENICGRPAPRTPTFAHSVEDLVATLGSVPGYQPVDVDAWSSEYVQVLDKGVSVVDFVGSTGLRPFVAAAGDRSPEFLAAYRVAIDAAYPVRSDGTTFFPFRRVFTVARRAG